MFRINFKVNDPEFWSESLEFPCCIEENGTISYYFSQDQFSELLKNIEEIGNISNEKIETFGLEIVDTVFPELEAIGVEKFWLSSKNEEKEGFLNIVLPYTQAFGTGHHETTRLCLRAIDKVSKPKDPYYDFGCGTGILAIAMNKIWGGKCIAVDNDPLAVKVAKDHVELQNPIIQNIDVLCQDAPDLSLKAGIIVANVMANPIISWAQDFAKIIKQGGVVIVSGFFNHQKHGVLEAYLNYFDLKEELNEGEWACYIFKTKEF